jgi:hypothetical protein
MLIKLIHKGPLILTIKEHITIVAIIIIIVTD